MKFEDPIMNISMFEIENVLTVSGDTTGVDAAAAAADEAIANATGTAKKITITF